MQIALDPTPLRDEAGTGQHDDGSRQVVSLRVGLTEPHGMAQEVSLFPASGVRYSFLHSSHRRTSGSTIGGVIGRYQADDVDLIEAVLSPIRTRNRWVYSLAHLAEACGFDVFGEVVPRARRVARFRQLISKDNFKKLIFWSTAGRDTLGTYAGIDLSELREQVAVVYPAVRRVPDDVVGYRNHNLRLLFSGDFFRKGGIHVVDAFERARQLYPDIWLTVCCDERFDFNTADRSLCAEYLNKLNVLPGIINRGRIDRERLMTEVYPNTDIVLIPTYVETFGMAILEAMAFGIPVISTNHFAIPEMIQDGVSGLLIDTTTFNCEQLFRGYMVGEIPKAFREYMTEAVFNSMCRLIESIDIRRSLGQAALDVARTKFSFERRNARMLHIYRRAMAD